MSGNSWSVVDYPNMPHFHPCRKVMATAMSDALACPVCYDLLNDPRMLNCGHTFCRKCLDDVFRTESCMQLTCPICRQVIQVPHGDVSKLPINITVKGLVEDLMKSTIHNDLQKRAEAKIKSLIEHAEFVNQQKQKVKDAIAAGRGEVGKAYNEAITKLTESKNALIDVFDDQERVLLEKLDKLVEKDIELVTNIGHAQELVEKENDKLTNILETKGPDASEASMITKHAEKLYFRKRQVDFNIGEIEETEWTPKIEDSLETHDLGFDLDLDFGLKELLQVEWKMKAGVKLTRSMSCLAPSPDGRMAVGYEEGGIDIFSADGQLMEKVLENVKILCLAFLSDGNCVVHDIDGDLYLYTRDWIMLNVRFESGIRNCRRHSQRADLTVDNENYIYIRKCNEYRIHVFTPEGGSMVREIILQCVPLQISVMHVEHSKMFAAKIRRNLVSTYDLDGWKEHELSKDHFLYPLACKNGTILIAFLNKNRDRVSIEEYTSELKYVKTLITDHVIDKSKVDWCFLQEFTSGEVAFCTCETLYIFQKIVSFSA